jgi:hypothetical protein
MCDLCQFSFERNLFCEKVVCWTDLVLSGVMCGHSGISKMTVKHYNQ